MKLQRVTIQVKALKHFFRVVLFIMLFMVVLTLKFANESLCVTS